jgi:hypothetical protein
VNRARQTRLALAAAYAVVTALTLGLCVSLPPFGWIVFAILAGGIVVVAVVSDGPERPRRRPPARAQDAAFTDESIELARRSGGGLDVLLLWNRPSGRVWVRVRHVGSGTSFTVDARPNNALEVFHHPFAYETASTE